jgi:transcriptional regulator with XRE-family HTH domain
METLKEIRRQKGWSQKDLADSSGVGQDTISGIESGRHEPRPSTLRKLAEALGVQVADFFKEPALPKADAPRGAGRPTIIDIAWDAARRQVALEKQAMFGSRKTVYLDQRYANEAMKRLRDEYALDGNDAEALFDFAKRHMYLEEEAAQIREENATLRDRLQERERAHP